MVGEGEIIEKCLRIGAADIAMEASERTNELEIWSRMELGQERTLRHCATDRARRRLRRRTYRPVRTSLSYDRRRPRRGRLLGCWLGLTEEDAVAD